MATLRQVYVSVVCARAGSWITPTLIAIRTTRLMIDISAGGRRTVAGRIDIFFLRSWCLVKRGRQKSLVRSQKRICLLTYDSLSFHKCANLLIWCLVDVGVSRSWY